MTEWITTCAHRPDWLRRDHANAESSTPCLVIAWSAAEPDRVGEAASLDERIGAVVLGRGGPTATDREERLRFFRQRPGQLEPTAPLRGEGISRRQCTLRASPAGVEVERVGRCPVLIDGQETSRSLVRPGQTLVLKDQLVLICSRRSPWAPLRSFELGQAPGFGAPDANGMVGESPAVWELREQLAFCASSSQHVLILGESGSGKELAARALHAQSARAARAMVTRNAATFPSTLIDAELFGNAPDYPNHGMPARAGVVGEAHNSTLFLDEIGELSPELQAHLLRVLDRGGEYQRLGDARVRQSDFRLIAATNRDPTELRLDLLGRLTLQIQLPGLGDRMEDVPLLVRHLLLQAARATPGLGPRFFTDTPVGPEPRVDPELIEALLRHRFTYHVRELEALLWKAVSTSPRDFVALSRELRDELARSPRGSTSEPAVPAPEPTSEEIVACLTRNGSHVTRAARELGLPSRYALYRLMRKHGIAVERAP